MKKIWYNKLVRDRIPQKIHKVGSECKTSTLPKQVFFNELLKKVGEEASALPKAKSKKDIIKELADILDVIEEIKKFKRITPGEIQKAQNEAMKIKGGFKKRLFLEWSSNNGYKTNERRYKK